MENQSEVGTPRNCARGASEKGAVNPSQYPIDWSDNSNVQSCEMKKGFIEDKFFEEKTIEIKENIVEVPVIQIKEVPVVNVVEVPEVQTEFVFKEVEVPVSAEIPIILPRQVPVEQEIQRNVPKPIDVVTYQEYVMPKLKAKYQEIKVPIYVPRYIEVPVPANFVTFHPEVKKYPPVSVERFPYQTINSAALVNQNGYIQLPTNIGGSFTPVMAVSEPGSVRSTIQPNDSQSMEKIPSAATQSQISRSIESQSRRSSMQSQQSSVKSDFFPRSPTIPVL